MPENQRPSADYDAPACWLGYTRQQIETLMGDRLAAFDSWMHGRTGAICDGRRYDHEKGEYEPTECADAPHGPVVYPWDLRRFLGTRHNHDAIGTYANCPGCSTVIPPDEPAFVDGDKVLDDLTEFLTETNDVPPGGPDA